MIRTYVAHRAHSRVVACRPLAFVIAAWLWLVLRSDAAEVRVASREGVVLEGEHAGDCRPTGYRDLVRVPIEIRKGDG